MLKLDIDPRGVARLRLHRPEVNNAFNMDLIQELKDTFERLGQDPAVRCIVLSGEGKHFSAGADVNWMRAQAVATFEENHAGARRMAEAFEAVDRCPKPVIGSIHGAALGGGSGLACVVDVVVAAENALFGFTEVRLGIVPAVISPFVIRRIGYSAARARFLTGSRFGAEEALRIGLAHFVTDNLDEQTETVVKEILLGAPEAHQTIKKLARDVWDMAPSGHLEYTVDTISRVRSGAEGREGLSAFLEKRSPGWIDKS